MGKGQKLTARGSRAGKHGARSEEGAAAVTGAMAPAERQPQEAGTQAANRPARAGPARTSWHEDGRSRRTGQPAFMLGQLVTLSGVPASTVHHYRRLGSFPPRAGGVRAALPTAITTCVHSC